MYRTILYVIGANLGLQTEKIISLGFISIVVSKKDTTRGLFITRVRVHVTYDDELLLMSWELAEKEHCPIES
jgi:hypothetical protein